MKKKILISLIAAVIIVIFAAICFPVVKVITVNQQTFDFIMSTRKKGEYFSLKGLTVNGETAYESVGDSWWLCSLPEDTDFNNLNFSFRCDRAALKLAILEKNFSEDSIENNQEIKFLVYSPKHYREYSLYITKLPIFALNTLSEGSWEDEPAEFNGINATAHIRGRSTKDYPKPGYHISLKEKTSLLGMREDDDWVLYAGYNDQERIRNVFSSNLWYNSCAGNNSFRVTNGYEYRYIELFHNGTYAGLYALGYKPDQKQFDIEDGEFLFQKVSLAEDDYELHGDITKSNEIGAWIALESEKSNDIRSVIDYWLFINFCAAVDNTDMNYYFALKSNENGYRAVYCPWDLDLTWGNGWNDRMPNYVEPYALNTDVVLPIKGHSFDSSIQKLVNCGDVDTIERLKSRYTELRQSEWSDESLNIMIDEYEELIFNSGAYERDVLRWPESTQMSDPNEKLSAFRDYVSKRVAWMDNMIGEL